MGELKKWREQKWVRIGTDGSIKGACGTSKNKKIQTDAFLSRKHVLFPKPKEPKLREKRSD